MISDQFFFLQKANIAKSHFFILNVNFGNLRLEIWLAASNLLLVNSTSVIGVIYEMLLKIIYLG